MQWCAVHYRASTPTRLLGRTGFKPAYSSSVLIIISPALCTLFQISIDTGYLPCDWRSANITPIVKKGNRSDPNNDRPVSLTSIPSKILEHVIYRHLMTHLETNAILSPGGYSLYSDDRDDRRIFGDCNRQFGIF